MKTVRKNVFETNSSSTHSVTIMSLEDYKRWENENLYYDFNNEVFVTHDEMIEKYLVENDLTEMDDEDSLDDFLEVDTTNHTTKSGDEIVIICKYGYNG